MLWNIWPNKQLRHCLLEVLLASYGNNKIVVYPKIFYIYVKQVITVMLMSGITDEIFTCFLLLF